MAKRSTDKLTKSDQSPVKYVESAATREWRKSLRAFALRALLPIETLPTKKELTRMFVTEQERFIQAMSSNTVTVWMYAQPTLNGLLYALLSRYTDYDQECFPASMDQFSVYSDAEILNAKFSNEWEVPEERLCVVYLGTASRNAYLTEILNEFVRHRLKRIPRSRTIFLFEGSRTEFVTIYGNVGECELNRDSYVIDWNPNSDQYTNKRRGISEGIISRTVPTVATSQKPLSGSIAKPDVPKQVQLHRKSKALSSKVGKTGDYHPEVLSSIDEIYSHNDSDNF